MPRCSPNPPDFDNGKSQFDLVNQSLEGSASKGFRTMVFASRAVDSDEWEKVSSRLQEAEIAVKSRDTLVEAVYLL